MAGLFSNTDALRIPPLQTGPPPNVSAHTIRRTNSYDVNCHVIYLKHGQRVRLKTLYVVYQDSGTAAPFRIDYRVGSAEMPEETSGQLHVIVTRAEAASDRTDGS